MDLQETIIKNTGWTQKRFNEIGWMAHERVFLSLGRFRQISICKIVHNLICTNEKPKRYYSKNDLCPSCEDRPENINHLLCCPSKYSADFRKKAQEELTTSLTRIGTPEKIASAILYGLSKFISQTNEQPHEKPPSFG
jgi:hypothetical protein